MAWWSPSVRANLAVIWQIGKVWTAVNAERTIAAFDLVAVRRMDCVLVGRPGGCTCPDSNPRLLILVLPLQVLYGKQACLG